MADADSGEEQGTGALDAEMAQVLRGEDTGLLPITGEMPANVIVVPLDDTILFPGMTVPVVYPPGPIREAVDFAQSQGPFVAFVPRKTPHENGAEITKEALFVEVQHWSGTIPLAEALSLAQWHEAYHIGQLEQLRQLAGKNDKVI